MGVRAVGEKPLGAACARLRVPPQLAMLGTTHRFLPSGRGWAGPEDLGFLPHLDDVISAVLAVDGLDRADVQAAKHF